MPDWGRELAEEEVKKYVNQNLAMFHRVQLLQMIHLPCFTDTDRQKIQASCTNEGNNETTFIFFQRLCCREGWVPHFVRALREQNMGNLAGRLESLYHSKLLPPPKTPPAASTPPAANRPSAPPLQPEANEQSPPGQTFNQALPWSHSTLARPAANRRLAPPLHVSEANEQSPPEQCLEQALPSFPLLLAGSATNPTPQDTGDYRVPVQENSHPAEKSKLTTDKGAAPGFPSAAGSPEQNWDGRQHHPVTVKNGRFGNAPRPEDSGPGSALPTGASGNQPEEDYYSSDSVLLALGGQREDSAAERKVHVLRGDPKRDNPPVVASLQSRPEAPRKNLPASQGSPENQMQLRMDPSSRIAPANDAQPSLTRTGTQPPLPVPDPVPEHPIRLPPSDLDGSSSGETKARREVLATGGDRPSGDFKPSVEEKRSLEETTRKGALAGRPQPGMETRPSAVGGQERDSRIFHSNPSEDDMPSKPGVLCSDLAAEPNKIGSDDAGETGNVYSGSSERLRMSNGGSVSASDSDPILISKSSSVGRSTTSTVRERNQTSGAVGATLPPDVDSGEEDTSFMSHHVSVRKNPSMDLMGVPTEDGASSLRAFPDSTSEGQPLNKAKDHQADKKVEDDVAPSDISRRLCAGIALAFLASLAYVLYKKK